MIKKSLIVFGGSSKSLSLIKELNPVRVYWQDEISNKKKYVDALNSIDHQLNDIICVNWPFITPEADLVNGNIYTIHESLLPGFSGCAPVNWSIIEGSSLFGITLFRQSKEVDAGHILFRDGFYMNNANATAVFKRMEICYEKCARFIYENNLQKCKKLLNFGNRSYYFKRTPAENVIQEGFDPDRLVNLFLSTTSDYPLIYESLKERYRIYSIKIFNDIVDYLPLGKPPSNAVKIDFYNRSFILFGEKLDDL